MRKLFWLIGVLLLAFGVLTVHFTIGPGPTWEHHTEWAEKYGLPHPSFEMFVLGAAATALGGCWLGFMLARRPRPRTR